MSTRYWFRAKRYGLGWTPVTWEGWTALAAFVLALALDTLLFPPRSALVPFIAGVLGPGVLFVATCWIKGEPPRWRWGDR